MNGWSGPRWVAVVAGFGLGVAYLYGLIAVLGVEYPYLSSVVTICATGLSFLCLARLPTATGAFRTGDEIDRWHHDQRFTRMVLVPVLLIPVIFVTTFSVSVFGPGRVEGLTVVLTAVMWINAVTPSVLRELRPLLRSLGESPAQG